MSEDTDDHVDSWICPPKSTRTIRMVSAEAFDALSAENARMREALEPFAAKADEIEQTAREANCSVNDVVAGTEYAECVRARAALSPAQKGEA